MQKKKEDLAEIIIALKNELQKNVELVEQRKVIKDELSSLGVGVVKKGSDYSLVTLKFDNDSKQGMVEDSINLGPEYAIALFKAKKFLVEDILQKL